MSERDISGGNVSGGNGTNPAPPDEVTLDAERSEADADHVADRLPTSDEESSADEARAALGNRLDDVAEHEREMNELGARQTGEGRVP